jgi:hypothetical protein
VLGWRKLAGFSGYAENPALVTLASAIDTLVAFNARIKNPAEKSAGQQASAQS